MRGNCPNCPLAKMAIAPVDCPSSHCAMSAFGALALRAAAISACGAAAPPAREGGGAGA